MRSSRPFSPPTKTASTNLGCDQEAAYLSLYLYRAAIELVGGVRTEDVVNAFESGKMHIDAPEGPVGVNPADHHVVRGTSVYRMAGNGEIEMLEHREAIRSDFVESVLNKTFGVRNGLKSLGKRVPNIQYNYMFYRA